MGSRAKVLSSHRLKAACILWGDCSRCAAAAWAPSTPPPGPLTGWPVTHVTCTPPPPPPASQSPRRRVSFLLPSPSSACAAGWPPTAPPTSAGFYIFVPYLLPFLYSFFFIPGMFQMLVPLQVCFLVRFQSRVSVNNVGNLAAVNCRHCRLWMSSFLDINHLLLWWNILVHK
jgi:hypothetical protein